MGGGGGEGINKIPAGDYPRSLFGFGFVYITKFSNKYESTSELILELRFDALV